MKKKIIWLLILGTFLYSNNITDIIKKNEQLDKQKEIFNQQKKDKKLKENKTIDINLLNIENDITEKNCIKIKKINIKKSSIFSENDLKKITDSYINKCHGMKSLNNLKNKISNMYLNKGYVTSRAYFKVQDLSDGIIDIDILEGKIEKIKDTNINSYNLGVGSNDEILNLRELEVAIQQAERLKSQSVSFELLPGNEVGYSIVSIKGQKVSNPYYGNINFNNYGSESRGKYQISSSFNYENLFDISDILSLNFNTTNKGFSKNNTYYGMNTSYTFPVGRMLFEIGVDYSKYEQKKKDKENEQFNLYGNTKNFLISGIYKLYHSQKHNLEVSTSLKYKENNNYLNDITLELQSYAYSVFNLGIKHSYIGQSYDYYSKLSMEKSLSLLSSKNNFENEEDKFKKFILDLNYNKYFSFLNRLKYNALIRGQYSNDNLYPTEEFSAGGPYSVRGFKKSGLSGKTGFYIKNEINNNYIIYKKINVSPYLGLDYGYVKKENIENIYGDIIGSSMGIRTFINNFNMEFFLNKALKTNKFTKDNERFVGINISYNY